ncbi:hypothetical protein LguiB_018527 [Lonicera macranthoides]
MFTKIFGKPKQNTNALSTTDKLNERRRRMYFRRRLQQRLKRRRNLPEQRWLILLEGAKATTETVDALRTGAAAMKAMQKATNIDDVDKTKDEIN